METLETNIFIERVHSSGLVELIFKDAQVFDVPDMLQAKKFSNSILHGQKIALLVSFQGAFYPTKEARELLADPGYSSHQKAIAVVTTNFSIRLLASLYIKINKPKTPLRLFSASDEALKWLGKYLTLHSL
jgi:hypothetical protein